MNNHLKKCTERYNKEDAKALIHPISEVDGQIVTEIIELFKKLNCVAVVDVLKEYKMQADDDIAMSLMDLNTKLASKIGEKKVTEGEQEPPKPKPDRYINILGRRIDLWQVISYDALNIDKDDELYYCIMWNPTPPETKKIPMYANNITEFPNEQERNDILEILDVWMETYRGRFI